MKEKISVIIVTYNAAEVLQDAIKSVLNQDYPNIELIIIDGKSTDETTNIINLYRKRIAYFISENDKGIYDAMNKGIIASTGDWILFLGADDTINTSKIFSTIFNNSHLNQTELLYGKIVFKNETKILGGETNMKKIIAENIPHQAIFYKRIIFDTLGLYNLRYKVLADHDFNYRIFESQIFKTQFIDSVVSIYNKKGASYYTIDYNFYREKLDYFIHNKKISKYNATIQNYFFYTGIALMLKGNYYHASKNIVHAILFNDRKLKHFLLAIKIILTKKRYKVYE